MTDSRGPVNRCAYRGCPVIGFWPAGGRCPMHQAAEFDPPRSPSLGEQWEVGDDE